MALLESITAIKIFIKFIKNGNRINRNIFDIYSLKLFHRCG